MRLRAAALLLALCAAAARCGATADGADAAAADAAAAAAAAAAAPGVQGAADGVTWLVQLSDLHLSAHGWADRCGADMARRERGAPCGPSPAPFASRRPAASATWASLRAACCAACAPPP